MDEKRFILAVDDEPMLLGFYEQALGGVSNCHDLRLARTMDDVKEIAVGIGARIDLAILDGYLGGGVMCWHVLSVLKNSGFRGKVLVITGNKEQLDDAPAGSLDQVMAVFLKPFSPSRLMIFIEAYLELAGLSKK